MYFKYSKYSFLDETTWSRPYNPIPAYSIVSKPFKVYVALKDKPVIGCWKCQENLKESALTQCQKSFLYT